jgi:hypothetical protein
VSFDGHGVDLSEVEDGGGCFDVDGRVEVGDGRFFFFEGREQIGVVGGCGGCCNLYGGLLFLWVIVVVREAH